MVYPLVVQQVANGKPQFFMGKSSTNMPFKANCQITKGQYDPDTDHSSCQDLKWLEHLTNYWHMYLPDKNLTGLPIDTCMYIIYIYMIIYE